MKKNTIPHSTAKKKILAQGVESAIKELTTSLDNSQSSPLVSKPLQTETPNNTLPQRNLTSAKKLLATKIEQGCLDGSLIEAIFDAEGFLPIEGTLIDYKRDVPEKTGELLKLIKHIQAFHNTYGGYLILGAEEIEKDIIIIPRHQNLNELDIKRVRDLCREYLSSPIELQAKKTAVIFKGETYEVQAIQIPKRELPEPVQFRKDGTFEGKQIFAREQVCLRDGDNSTTASSTSHWRLLYGPRKNPFLSTESLSGPISLLENNLPDRGFICQKFIGRQDTLEQLFLWLSDDFSCVRVLAGEGGLGKTSIAFEFAYEVARGQLGASEIVLWFTAKKFQFRALENQYEPISFSSFSDSSELFREMALELGSTQEELSDISSEKLPKHLKSITKTIRAFIVIDDLDSLEINEQKRCIEVCQQLSGSGSRFLFTTRKNATASSSTAIELQGLSLTDYESLIKSWEERLKLPQLTAKQIARLHDASQGSPLYTESLLRLIKGGIPINDAIAKWKGNLGIEVRNAALKREVLELSPESKKTLVTAAVFGECSFAEIKQATGFSDITLTDCMGELQSLFLISAPSIAGQPRYKISNTTRELVISLGPELTPRFSSYSEQIKLQRYKPKDLRINSQIVGAAINQAMALITSENPEEALKTVDEINTKLGGKHPDLLFMRARALAKLGEVRSQECRKAFKTAYENGQRKMKFFQLWYEFESESKFFETAIEVASNAIDAGAGQKSDWLINRAHSRIHSASAQAKREDWGHMRSQFNLAADDLHEASKDKPEMVWETTWKEHLYNTHDSLWRLERKFSESIPEVVSSLDSQLAAIDRGDHRYEVFIRLPKLIHEIEAHTLKNNKEMSTREYNLIQQSIKKSRTAFMKAPKNLRTLRQFDVATRDLDQLAKNYRLQ